MRYLTATSKESGEEIGEVMIALFRGRIPGMLQGPWAQARAQASISRAFRLGNHTVCIIGCGGFQERNVSCRRKRDHSIRAAKYHCARKTNTTPYLCVLTPTAAVLTAFSSTQNQIALHVFATQSPVTIYHISLEPLHRTLTRIRDQPRVCCSMAQPYPVRNAFQSRIADRTVPSSSQAQFGQSAPGPAFNRQAPFARPSQQPAYNSYSQYAPGTGYGIGRGQTQPPLRAVGTVQEHEDEFVLTDEQRDEINEAVRCPDHRNEIAS